MLAHPDGSAFTTGKTTCEIRPIPGGGQDANRIIIPITVEGVFTRAVVDTGGVYLIIQPDIAQELGLDPANAVGTDTLGIRNTRVSGSLHRVYLRLQAEEGEDMLQEVTAFIPDTNIEGWGDLPTYLGLTGCLEFIRFAVDPGNDQFYFSSI